MTVLIEIFQMLMEIKGVLVEQISLTGNQKCGRHMVHDLRVIGIHILHE